MHKHIYACLYLCLFDFFLHWCKEENKTDLYMYICIKKKATVRGSGKNNNSNNICNNNIALQAKASIKRDPSTAENYQSVARSSILCALLLFFTILLSQRLLHLFSVERRIHTYIHTHIYAVNASHTLTQTQRDSREARARVRFKKRKRGEHEQKSQLQLPLNWHFINLCNSILFFF